MSVRTMTLTAPVSTTPSLAPTRVVFARDLTACPGARPLWRLAASVPGGTPAAPPPGPGWPSPMGFWLSEAEGEPGAGAGPGPGATFRLRVLAPGSAGESESERPATQPPGFGRPSRTVRIKAANSSDGDVIVTISATDARVVAAPAAWNALSEPVLLAVCQYWRLATINDQIEQLTESAAGDLGHASMTRPSTLLRGRSLVEQMVAVRALLLDLAHFQGPLTDPYSYLSSDRVVSVYQSLAEKLHLDEWCKLLDDRIEMVEDTYACATEKLFEFKNFAWEAFLEVVIIVLLSAEVFVQLLGWYE